METGTASPPPRKRQRQEGPISTRKSSEPRLFVPFRALGLITNHIPFVLQTRSFKGATEGPRIHILTCLGKAWALWEGGKMSLLFVGVCSLVFSYDYRLRLFCRTWHSRTDIKSFPRWWCGMGSLWTSCNKVSAGKTGVFLSAFSRLFVFNRSKATTLINPLDTPLSFITIFGASLLALTEDGQRMLIWSTTNNGRSSGSFGLQSLIRHRAGVYHSLWSRFHCDIHPSPCNICQ